MENYQSRTPSRTHMWTHAHTGGDTVGSDLQLHIYLAHCWCDSLGFFFFNVQECVGGMAALSGRAGPQAAQTGNMHWCVFATVHISKKHTCEVSSAQRGGQVTLRKSVGAWAFLGRNFTKYGRKAKKKSRFSTKLARNPYVQLQMKFMVLQNCHPDSVRWSYLCS